MKTPVPRKRKVGNLRARAEKLILKESGDETVWSAEEAPGALHELRARDLSLRMQNEELQRQHLELEDTLERYSHLYDFAPCGYASRSSGTAKSRRPT